MLQSRITYPKASTRRDQLHPLASTDAASSALNHFNKTGTLDVRGRQSTLVKKGTSKLTRPSLMTMDSATEPPTLNAHMRTEQMSKMSKISSKMQARRE